MKKLFALLLVAVMCFSLVACGGGNDTPTANNNEQQTNNSGSQQETETNTTNTEEFDLYQNWLNTNTGEKLVFGEDGNVFMADALVKFEYDTSAKTVSFEINGEKILLNIITEDGIYKLSNDSVCFVTANNYLSESIVVGKWECKENNSTLILNADGTAELTDFGMFTWTYNDNLVKLYNEDGESRDFPYSEDDDTLQVHKGTFGIKGDGYCIYNRVTE